MSTIQPLNLAIVGCGAVVEELHLPALRRLAREGALNVSFIVDRSAERMARIRKYFPAAGCFNDLAAAFAAGQANAALVASPPAFHSGHVKSAFAHGCQVLCEKPLAVAAKEVADLAEAAAKARRLLMVGMTRRFFPPLAAAAAMLRAGELGDDIQFSYFEGDVYQWPIASDAPFRRELGGGGVLMDKGVHVLDSLLWLFGPMTVVRCEDDAMHGGVESNSRVTLEGKGGCGTMQLSWDQGLANGLRISGSKGDLKVNPGEFRWVEFRQKGGTWERRPCRADWPASVDARSQERTAPRTYEDCIYIQWIQFCRAVALNGPVPVDANAALTVTQQIETAYANASYLAQDWLDSKEQAAASERHWKAGAVK